MPAKKKKEEEKEKKQSENEEIVEDQTEVVSCKKVVYAEIDDEVTTLYDRIKRIRQKHVYIVVPIRAILFQSVVNLKILKRKAADTKKTIYLITNDRSGIHLAAQVGIEVYNKANDEGKPTIFSAEVDDEKLRITPLKATVNAATEEAPTRLSERKLSISELLRRGKKKNSIDITKLKEPKKRKINKPKLVIVAPNRHALIALTAVSLIILFVIVYIALPGVTVYLTPSASVLEKSVNITLADYQKNKSELETRPIHMIASYPISTTVSKNITHFATGKKVSDKGANSSGTITIVNASENNWPLITETRFQNSDGFVFRIKSPVTVPANSSVEATVVADPVDAYGGIVGERGNIGPTKFFLPGLRDDSQSKLYAESSVTMTGGITDFVTYISPEDLEAASARINDELLRDAVELLREEVRKKAELTGDPEAYSLLNGDGAIKIGDVQVAVPTQLEGSSVSEFSVDGTVYVSGVYYDHNSMLEILKSELLLKKSPQKELLRINEESTTYRIFEWDDARGKIKMTANIKGVEQFEIDPDKESGERLLSKIRDHIAGKDIEDAKVFIQNLSEINRVEIESWPAWAPTVPSLPDNIEFEVRDSVNVE